MVAEEAVTVITFDELPFKTFVHDDWIDAENVGIIPGRCGAGAAEFNGTQHIEFPRLNNHDFRSSLTLSIWFNIDSSVGSRKVNILSNGNCVKPARIEINYENGVVRLLLVTSVNDSETTTTIEANVRPDHKTKANDSSI